MLAILTMKTRAKSTAIRTRTDCSNSNNKDKSNKNKNSNHKKNKSYPRLTKSRTAMPARMTRARMTARTMVAVLAPPPSLGFAAM